MKIGILTFHDADNYGAVLQAYSLKEYIKKNIDGCKVEIVNYKSQEILNGSKLVSIDNTSIKNSVISILRSIVYLPTSISKKNKFKKFRQDYLDLSSKSYLDSKQISGYDLYVVGSDQVWNTDIIGNDTTYFLDFKAEYSKGISYAASLGRNELDNSKINNISKISKNFDFISVREESSIKEIKKITSKEVINTLDPTLITSQQLWSKIISCSSKNEKYVLVYMLSMNEEVLKIASRISKMLGIDVWYINNSYKKNKYGFKNIRKVGPKEFLDLFKNASFVVTNSFHGTTFSIIFNKNFITVPHLTRGNRMKDLLKKLQLQDRIVTNSNEIRDDYKIHIDYTKVEYLLREAQKQSTYYLLNSINSIKNNNIIIEATNE